MALLGPDGAGKSTVSERLPGLLGRPARHVYMGINLEASNLLLPTTRLLLEIKRALGRRPDMTPDTGVRTHSHTSSRAGTLKLKMFLRMTNLIAEEWFRQAVIWWYRRRGEVVVLDRHFLFDYYDSDVESDGPIPLVRRIHGYLLREIYPRPDLTIVLDAPGVVLFARKGEASVSELERRRHRYVQMLDLVTRSAVVDATQPIDDVVASVARVVEQYQLER